MRISDWSSDVCSSDLAKLNKTIVFITHDLDEALRLGNRIAILKDGELVQEGTPEDILLNPANDYVQAFLQDVNRTKVLNAAHAEIGRASCRERVCRYV